MGMRFRAHVEERLLRDLVKYYRTPGAQSALKVTIEKIEEQLQAIDAAEAAAQARETARRQPPLSTQKVLAVLRQAKLQISVVPSGRAGIGGATGFRVEYGDWNLRTWVRVGWTFAWDYGNYRGWSDEQKEKAKKAERLKQIEAAQAALRGAGLHVESTAWLGTENDALRVMRL
jgi:hypothetical protein